jgi:TPR repeat protein
MRLKQQVPRSKEFQARLVRISKIQRQPILRTLLGLLAALLVFGCAATDPMLRSAIEVSKKNPTAARVKLRPFALQGDPKAEAAICEAYGRSIDSEVRNREREEAFGWCVRAANAGHLESQYHLGSFYLQGNGVKEDRAMALRWFTVAAERGHLRAEDSRRGLLGLPAVCRNWITNCRMF